MKKHLIITAWRCIIIALLFFLWGIAGFAQVSVSNTATTYTTKQISFTVSWTSAPYNNQIWVIVDYIKIENASTVGSWSRALVTAVAKNSGTGSVATVTGNRGFWLNTSGSSGSAHVTATISLASGVNQFNWCAYALNKPPTAELQSNGSYLLKGTPPFVVNGTTLGSNVTTFGPGTCIATLADATGNPTSVLPAAPSITLTTGSSAQTATQNSALPGLKYTTANASGATKTSGSFPAGVSGVWSANVYTISGTPTAAGTFTYIVATTNLQNCTNASKSGTVTVVPAGITYTGCTAPTLNLGTVGFANSTTYSRNGITISAPVTATYCQKTTYAGGSSPYNADCRTNPSYDGDLFSWCMVVQYAAQLCPSPWRVPTTQDFMMYANGSTSSSGATSGVYSGMHGWLLGGFCVSNGGLTYQGVIGNYWSSSEFNSVHGIRAYVETALFGPQYSGNSYKYYGFSLRCVR